MNLDENLRMAKQFHYDKITVDVDGFEARLFENLSENKRSMKGRLHMNTKWKIASVAALGIIAPGVVYAGVILNVNNHTISHMKPDVPATSFIANGIKNQNIAKVYDLSQARSVANFPIREPASISGWNHTDSQGFLWKHLQSPATGVDSYYDVYTSTAGLQVTVQQNGGLDANKFGTTENGSKIQFGSDNYHADLYTTSSGGQKELLITVKEPNNTLTHIEITGSVTADDLQIIGDAYITASK
jgi:hypothetical protein